MSAPDGAPKSALKIPLALGAVTYVAQMGLGDSCFEPSMMVGRDEQLGPYEVQDHKLVILQ